MFVRTYFLPFFKFLANREFLSQKTENVSNYLIESHWTLLDSFFRSCIFFMFPKIRSDFFRAVVSKKCALAVLSTMISLLFPKFKQLLRFHVSKRSSITHNFWFRTPRHLLKSYLVLHIFGVFVPTPPYFEGLDFYNMYMYTFIFPNSDFPSFLSKF